MSKYQDAIALIEDKNEQLIQVAIQFTETQGDSWEQSGWIIESLTDNNGNEHCYSDLSSYSRNMVDKAIEDAIVYKNEPIL